MMYIFHFKFITSDGLYHTKETTIKIMGKGELKDDVMKKLFEMELLLNTLPESDTHVRFNWITRKELV